MKTDPDAQVKAIIVLLFGVMLAFAVGFVIAYMVEIPFFAAVLIVASTLIILYITAVEIARTTKGN